MSVKIALTTLLPVLSLLGLSTLSSHAETVAGYRFENYPAPLYIGKPAKLDYKSDPIAKLFKTRITEAYQQGEIGFGGNFVVAMWGCGTGCISGAMADKRTGRVYPLPINEETAYDFGCWSVDDSNEDERVSFYPNSRLLITRTCEQAPIENSNTAKRHVTYYVNVWNDKTKKFNLIKTVKQKKMVITEQQTTTE